MDIISIIKEHSKFDGKQIVIDVEAMKTQLISQLLKPAFIGFKAKIDSGEIDIIKGTEMDKVVLDKVLEMIIEKM